MKSKGLFVKFAVLTVFVLTALCMTLTGCAARMSKDEISGVSGGAVPLANEVFSGTYTVLVNQNNTGSATPGVNSSLGWTNGDVIFTLSLQDSVPQTVAEPSGGTYQYRANGGEWTNKNIKPDNTLTIRNTATPGLSGDNYEFRFVNTDAGVYYSQSASNPFNVKIDRLPSLQIQTNINDYDGSNTALFILQINLMPLPVCGIKSINVTPSTAGAFTLVTPVSLTCAAYIVNITPQGNKATTTYTVSVTDNLNRTSNSVSKAFTSRNSSGGGLTVGSNPAQTAYTTGNVTLTPTGGKGNPMFVSTNDADYFQFNTSALNAFSGTWYVSSTATAITVKQNGIYFFYTLGNGASGQEFRGSIQVSNIDRTPPKLRLIDSDTADVYAGAWIEPGHLFMFDRSVGPSGSAGVKVERVNETTGAVLQTLDTAWMESGYNKIVDSGRYVFTFTNGVGAFDKVDTIINIDKTVRVDINVEKKFVDPANLGNEILGTTVTDRKDASKDWLIDGAVKFTLTSESYISYPGTPSSAPVKYYYYTDKDSALKPVGSPSDTYAADEPVEFFVTENQDTEYFFVSESVKSGVSALSGPEMVLLSVGTPDIHVDTDWYQKPADSGNWFVNFSVWSTADAPYNAYYQTSTDGINWTPSSPAPLANSDAFGEIWTQEVSAQAFATYYRFYIKIDDPSGEQTMSDQFRIAVEPAKSVLEVVSSVYQDAGSGWIQKNVITVKDTSGHLGGATTDFYYSLDNAATWTKMNGSTLTVGTGASDPRLTSWDGRIYFQGRSKLDPDPQYWSSGLDNCYIKVDNKATVTASDSSSAWTKDPVTLTLTVETGGSGVQDIAVEWNGYTVNSPVFTQVNQIGNVITFTYVAAQNGTYKFTVKNYAGVTAPYSISVARIDDNLPTFNLKQEGGVSGNDDLVAVFMLTGNNSVAPGCGVTYQYRYYNKSNTGVWVVGGLDPEGWTDFAAPVSGFYTLNITTPVSRIYQFRAVSGSTLEWYYGTDFDVVTVAAASGLTLSENYLRAWTNHSLSVPVTATGTFASVTFYIWDPAIGGLPTTNVGGAGWINTGLVTAANEAATVFTVPQNGTYFFGAVDSSLNEKTLRVIIENIDKSEPQLTVTPDSGYWYNNGFQFTFHVTDAGDAPFTYQYRYKLKGAANWTDYIADEGWKTVSHTFTPSLSDGEYVFEFRAKNAAGTYANHVIGAVNFTWISYSFGIDRVAPAEVPLSRTDTLTESGQTVAASITYTIRIAFGISGMKDIRLPGYALTNLTDVNGDGTVWSVKFKATAPGTYTIIAENNSGLQNTVPIVIEITTEINVTPPTCVVAYVGPTLGEWTINPGYFTITPGAPIPGMDILYWVTYGVIDSGDYKTAPINEALGVYRFELTGADLLKYGKIEFTFWSEVWQTGVTSQTTTYTVWYDAGAPVITVDSGAQQGTVGAYGTGYLYNATVEFGPSGRNSGSITFGGYAVTNGADNDLFTVTAFNQENLTVGFTLTVKKAGTYALKASSIAPLNIEGSAAGGVFVPDLIDRVIPAFTVTASGGYVEGTYTKNPVTVGVDGQTPGKSGIIYTYTLNGEDMGGFTGGTQTETGVYVYVITATTGMGETRTVTYTVRIDKDAPELIVSAGALAVVGNGVYGTHMTYSVKVTFRTDDAGGTVKLNGVTVNGIAVTAEYAIEGFSFSGGVMTFTFNALQNIKYTIVATSGLLVSETWDTGSALDCIDGETPDFGLSAKYSTGGQTGEEYVDAWTKDRVAFTIAPTAATLTQYSGVTYYYKIGSGTETKLNAGVYTADTSALSAAGTYVYTFRVIAGNGLQTIKTFTVKYDNSAPAVSQTSKTLYNETNNPESGSFGEYVRYAVVVTFKDSGYGTVKLNGAEIIIEGARQTQNYTGGNFRVTDISNTGFVYTITFDALDNGTYTIVAESKLGVAGVSTVGDGYWKDTLSNVIDKVAPAFGLDVKSDGKAYPGALWDATADWTDKSVIFALSPDAATVGAPSGVKYYYRTDNADAAADWTAPGANYKLINALTFTVSDPGEHVYYIWAVTGLGRTFCEQVTVRYDAAASVTVNTAVVYTNTKPGIAGSEGNAYGDSADITVTVTTGLSGLKELTYTLPGGGSRSVSPSQFGAPALSGNTLTYTITINTSDIGNLNGSYSFTAQSVTLKTNAAAKVAEVAYIDTATPTFVLEIDGTRNSWTNTAVVFTLSVQPGQPISGVWYYYVVRDSDNNIVKLDGGGNIDQLSGNEKTEIKPVMIETFEGSGVWEQAVHGTNGGLLWEFTADLTGDYRYTIYAESGMLKSDFTTAYKVMFDDFEPGITVVRDTDAEKEEGHPEGYRAYKITVEYGVSGYGSFKINGKSVPNTLTGSVLVCSYLVLEEDNVYDIQAISGSGATGEAQIVIDDVKTPKFNVQPVGGNIGSWTGKEVVFHIIPETDYDKIVYWYDWRNIETGETGSGVIDEETIRNDADLGEIDVFVFRADMPGQIEYKFYAIYDEQTIWRLPSFAPIVMFDDTPPVLTVNGKPTAEEGISSKPTNENITITLNADYMVAGTGYIEVSVDGAATRYAGLSATELTFTITKNGFYSFKAVSDTGIASEAASINVTWIIKDGPAVTGTVKSVDYTEAQLKGIEFNKDVKITARSYTEVTVTKNGKAIKLNASETTDVSNWGENYVVEGSMTFKANGTYMVTFWDEAGNASTVMFTISRPNYGMIFGLSGLGALLLALIIFVIIYISKNRAAMKRVTQAATASDDENKFVMMKRIK